MFAGLSRVKNIFRSQQSPNIEAAGMTPEEQRLFKKNGFLVIENAVSPEYCDQVLYSIETFRKSPESGPDKDRYNDRIGQIHQVAPKTLELAANSKIYQKLSSALNDEPLLFGSLSFSQGTEQDAHIDSIFFYTEPAHAMAGAWYALEDIKPEAGPLFYYPGSHLWPFTRGEEIQAAHPELSEKVKAARQNLTSPETNDLVCKMGQLWTNDLKKKISEKGATPAVANIKKGDCVLWHALLVHGGMPRLNPSLTRKSIVFHYIGRNAELHTFSDFFLKSNKEILSSQGLGKNIRTMYGIPYIKHNHFSRYDKSGNEIVQYF